MAGKKNKQQQNVVQMCHLNGIAAASVPAPPFYR
jgi:hypothetical protein